MAVRMPVDMGVVMRRRRTAIGAAFGIEGRLDLVHMAAQAFDHLGDYVVGADADAVVANLRRQVAIADMPGNTRHVDGVMGVDFQQRFRRSPHQYGLAIVQHDTVAIAQVRHLAQIQQKLVPTLAFQHDAAAMTMVIVQHHLVEERALGLLGSAGGGAQVMSAPSMRTS